MEKPGYLYIMTNWTGRVLYVGVTSDLKKRVYQHRTRTKECFTQRYNLDRLVYYEIHPSIEGAIWREKQLKAGPRARKVAAIERMNPGWVDLYDRI